MKGKRNGKGQEKEIKGNGAAKGMGEVKKNKKGKEKRRKGK